MKLKLFIVSFLLLASHVYATEKIQPQTIEITATDEGFEPSSIDVKAGIPVILKVTRKSKDTCATEIQIKSKKVDQPLPLNKTQTVKLGQLEKGDLDFSCAMKMMKGVIHVK